MRTRGGFPHPAGPGGGHVARGRHVVRRCVRWWTALCAGPRRTV